MTRMANWQHDETFLHALRRRAYLHADGKPVMAGGIYLYMYEAWLDARRVYGATDVNTPCDDAQLTLHEVTAVMIAACAALEGNTADMSPTTKRDLRTAHAKLATALEILGATPNPRATPRPRKPPSPTPRRTPKPKPRRARAR